MRISKKADIFISKNYVLINYITHMCPLKLINKQVTKKAQYSDQIFAVMRKNPSNLIFHLRVFRSTSSGLA